jgi:hypothetical protein
MKEESIIGMMQAEENTAGTDMSVTEDTLLDKKCSGH